MASTPGLSSTGQSAPAHPFPQVQQVPQFVASAGPVLAYTSPSMIPLATGPVADPAYQQPPSHAAASGVFSTESQIHQIPGLAPASMLPAAGPIAGYAPVSQLPPPAAISALFSSESQVPQFARPAPVPAPPPIIPPAGPVAGFVPAYQQPPPHAAASEMFSPQFAGPALLCAYPPPLIPFASGPAHIYQVGRPADPVTHGPYRYGNSAEVSFHIDVYENGLIKTITDRHQESLTYDEQGFLNMRFNISGMKLESLAEERDYGGLMRLGDDEETFYKREFDHYQHKRDYVKAELRGAIMWHQMHSIPTSAHLYTENYIKELRKALQLYVSKHVALKKEYQVWLKHFESAKHKCCAFLTRYGYGIL